MSDSNWSIESRLILGGCAAIAIVGLLLSADLEWGQNQQTDQQPQYPANYETPLGAPVNAWREGGTTYQSICDAPDSREDADLCQQWRSAESAAKLVDVSYLQLWATWISVAGLIVTIALTFRATKAAQRSAEAAEAAIDGADRPYLIVSRLEVTPFDAPLLGDKTPFLYQFTNHGKGPGWIAQYSVWAHRTDADEVASPEDHKPILAETNWPIAPNAWWGTPELTAAQAFTFNAEERNDILSGATIFHLVGIMRYKNAAGKTFEYCWISRYLPDQKRFIPLSHPFAKYT